MINYKMVMEETEVIDSIECDICHVVYRGEEERSEFTFIDFTAGYYSQTFIDGTRVECDICQYCLHKMISDSCRCSDRY